MLCFPLSRDLDLFPVNLEASHVFLTVEQFTRKMPQEREESDDLVRSSFAQSEDSDRDNE